MIIYTYEDATTPHGIRAFTSLKKALSRRAQDFIRPERPEVMMVDIGKLTHQRACDLLTGENYALQMDDIA